MIQRLTLASSLFICLLLLCSSCANYRLHREHSEDTYAPEESLKPTHSLFLIGSTGAAEETAGLELLGAHLAEAPRKSTVLFMGDHVPQGMPPESDTDGWATTQRLLDRELQILDNFKGRPLFLPGDRDWHRYGARGIRRQEQYVEAYLNRGIEDEDDWKNYYRPDGACSGPEVIELNDRLVLVLVDSQWWLEDWDEDPYINTGCEVESRERFAEIMADVYEEYEGKNVVVASHHALRSVGPYGGASTFKEHLFPLTALNDNLYLPLPGIGSVATAIRKSGISKQDQSNATNKAFQRALMNGAGPGEEIIFVAGHDHSLQYLNERGRTYVGSGSGSDATVTAARRKAEFSYGTVGISRIDFYEDGSAWLEFHIPPDDGTNPLGVRVFRQQIKEALPPAEPPVRDYDFSEYESGIDSSLQFPVTFEVRDKGKLGRAMLGEHHRAVYLEKINFPVLDLATFKGGLTPIKKGGGKQTHSIRFRNPEGHEYVMRSLTKDLKTIPYPFNRMNLVNFLFKENFLAINPFMSLAIPVLAEASGIYHTNPNIYYVPKQPTLGAFNEDFGNEVYLVEERASKDRSDLESFGNASKFVSTPDLVEKMRNNHKHRVDQRWVARSRLFDLLIGDFDRHDDQWRWAVVEDNEAYKLYRPVPRDRDQAFSRYDGIILGVTAPYHMLLRQVTDYEAGIKDYGWATHNTRFFDHDFMNELTLEDFLAEATYIQEHLTDEAIDAAFDRLPPYVQSISTERISRALRGRRDDLPNMARAFYAQLSKQVVLHGADKREFYEIIHRNGGETEVNIYDQEKDKVRGERLYHRVFRTSETKEIMIYGLGKDDIFSFSGTADRGVLIRAIGGAGEDKFVDESSVGGRGRTHHIYDSREGTELQLNEESRDRTGNIRQYNTYDRLGSHLDKPVFVPFPLAGFNVDDGLLLGARGDWIIPAFKRQPYGQRHSVGATYAFATGGLEFESKHEFIGAASRWDLLVYTNLRNDRYAFNFFGLGNDSEPTAAPIDRSNLNFYRVRQNLAALHLGLQRRFGDELGKFVVGPLIEATSIQDTPDRFIGRDDTGLQMSDLEARLYVGLRAALSLSSIDNHISPREGFQFHLSSSLRSDLRGSDRSFMRYETGLKLYKSIGRGTNPLTFATYVGAAHAGADTDFFLLPTLGQQENIRGFFQERYRGRTSFFQLTDVRLSIGGWNNAILPFSFGLTGSFDHGRIWSPGENSDTWHSSYGGGIFLVPLNLTVVTVSYHVADGETGLFRVKVGHGF